jgi:hypothetical protein
MDMFGYTEAPMDVLHNLSRERIQLGEGIGYVLFEALLK